MTQASTPLRGVVRGRTIELESEHGLPEGQHVEVTVEMVEGLPTPSNPASQTDAQRRRSEAQ